MDLLQFQSDLKIRLMDGQKKIFCLIRKKWLVLQPEELVRQLFIHYLIQSRGYAIEKIAVERLIRINGLMKRFDILVYDQQIRPFILVECKSMFVELNQEVMDQAGAYNLSLDVPYIVVTNGRKTICYAMNYETKNSQLLNDIPKKDQEI